LVWDGADEVVPAVLVDLARMMILSTSISVSAPINSGADHDHFPM
jgi:hypothetical protein